MSVRISLLHIKWDKGEFPPKTLLLVSQKTIFWGASSPPPPNEQMEVNYIGFLRSRTLPKLLTTDRNVCTKFEEILSKLWPLERRNNSLHTRFAKTLKTWSGDQDRFSFYGPGSGTYHVNSSRFLYDVTRIMFSVYLHQLVRKVCSSSSSCRDSRPLKYFILDELSKVVHKFITDDKL